MCQGGRIPTSSENLSQMGTKCLLNENAEVKRSLEVMVGAKADGIGLIKSGRLKRSVETQVQSFTRKGIQGERKHLAEELD